jgi:replicative DNA helicase
LPTLDNYLEGFREGDLVVVSGITKGGKTTFCQTLTHSFSEQKISCLWFSYEMAKLEFMEKFGNNLPMFTMPQKLKGNSLKWLEERIVESMAKYGTKIVFIDHLHFLLDMSFLGQNKGGNMSLIIGGIMRELKKIALYRGITIVLIAHTAKIKFEAEPSLSDIRDSSFISQEADTVLMIWRNRSALKPNQAVLAVLANRRTGQNGTIDLLLKDKRFIEVDKNYLATKDEIDVNKMFK